MPQEFREPRLSLVLTVLNAPWVSDVPRAYVCRPVSLAPVGAVREPPLRVSSVIIRMPWRWFGMTTNSSNAT